MRRGFRPSCRRRPVPAGLPAAPAPGGRSAERGRHARRLRSCPIDGRRIGAGDRLPASRTLAGQPGWRRTGRGRPADPRQPQAFAPKTGVNKCRRALPSPARSADQQHMRRFATVAARCVRETGGFALLEVLAANVVLAAGLGATFLMLNAALHATSNDRFRQAETSLARELTEDTRSLAYTQLTPSAIATALQSSVSGSTASGSTLIVNRGVSGQASSVSFTATFTACSMDDPADGTGDHTQAPASGGSWCTDVGSSGSTDTQPDDYKRVSVTVAPTSGRTTPTVQQTILIYNKTTHGPAVSCLSISSTVCPGSNQTYTSGTQLTFYVTTTAVASSIEWLVNGSRPASSQLTTGEDDPYTPSTTQTSFTWVFPTAADGTYTISAQAFDANGNSGTKSQLQITVNLHQAIPPATVYAGYNQQIGGVDVQWVPSVDQDVLY